MIRPSPSHIISPTSFYFVIYSSHPYFTEFPQMYQVYSDLRFFALSIESAWSAHCHISHGNYLISFKSLLELDFLIKAYLEHVI